MIVFNTLYKFEGIFSKKLVLDEINIDKIVVLNDLKFYIIANCMYDIYNLLVVIKKCVLILYTIYK